MQWSLQTPSLGKVGVELACVLPGLIEENYSIHRAQLQVQEKPAITYQCHLDKLVGSSDWQGVRALREAVRRLVCLRRPRDVSL